MLWELVALVILAGCFVKWQLNRSNQNRIADGVRARALQARRERNLKILEAYRLLDRAKARGEMPGLERGFIESLTAANLWKAMHDATLPLDQQLTCYKIMLHFVERALCSQDKYTCLAQVRFTEALEEAKAVDVAIADRRAGRRNDEPGLLEGVPLSVKDDYDQKGFDTTCGLAARCGRPCKEDGLMVSLLRDAGAIPFCRTSTPQALLLPETMSAAWGRAQNPFNRKRTSGGSSGGEAALLASRGSPLGIGSDVGGSLRNPSHFCGLFAFKATPERLSLEGTGEPNINGESGQTSIRAACGPMAHSVEDLILVLRAWMTNRMWMADATVPPLPLLLPPPDTKLLLPRVGYYTDDGYFAPSPACIRAVDEVVAQLALDGHECVPFAPPLVAEAVGAYYELMSADNCQAMIAGFEGERPCDEYASLLLLTRVPRWIGRWVVAPLLEMVGEKRLAQLVHWCRPARTASELHESIMQQARCRTAFLAQMDKQNVDVLVCPGHALPAFLHGTSQDLTPSCSYNLLYNLLGFPVGSVPVTWVRPTEQFYRDARFPTDSLTQKAARVCAGSAQLPIGVQVVARPFCDEQALQLMRAIESCGHAK